jgi:hypothetical protein
MSHQPDNIFAGTQVVSPVVVWGMNNPLLLSPGASGESSAAPPPAANKRKGRAVALWMSALVGVVLIGVAVLRLTGVKDGWEADQRHVNRAAVQRVMEMFDEMFVCTP